MNCINYNTTGNKKKMWLTRLLAISAILACVVAFAGCSAKKSGSEGEASVCEECNEEFFGNGKYCEECKAEKKKNDTAGKCKMCKSELSSGALLCDSCLGKIDEEFYDGNYCCEYCNKVVEKKNIARVNTYGYVYCVDCDTENYCEGCNSLLERDDDDAFCASCASLVCDKCGEVLGHYEVAYDGEEGLYCESCYDTDMN